MQYMNDKEILEIYNSIKHAIPTAALPSGSRYKPYKDLSIRVLKSSMFYKTYIPKYQRSLLYVAYRAKLLLEPVNTKIAPKYLVAKLHQKLEAEGTKALIIGNITKSNDSIRYKASKKNAIVPLDKWDKIYMINIYKTARWLSTFCEPYHVDHVVPLAKGGKHHPDNLQILPAEINRAKSDKLDFYK